MTGDASASVPVRRTLQRICSVPCRPVSTLVLETQTSFRRLKIGNFNVAGVCHSREIKIRDRLCAMSACSPGITGITWY